jgi:hypothetical protein
VSKAKFPNLDTHSMCQARNEIRYQIVANIYCYIYLSIFVNKINMDEFCFSWRIDTFVAT